MKKILIVLIVLSLTVLAGCTAPIDNNTEVENQTDNEEIEQREEIPADTSDNETTPPNPPS